MNLQLLRGAILNRGAAFSDWFIKYIWWIIFTMGGILFALEIDELIVRAQTGLIFSAIVGQTFQALI